MDPAKTFCPNIECVARGQIGKGNIKIHSQKERRYKCKECNKTFAETTGTPYYRLHKVKQVIDLVTVVVTLLSHGCPLQAIVAAFGLDERTVSEWRDRAGKHCEAVHKHLVEKPRDLGQVQADELRVTEQGRIVWMAMAIMVSSRLWLGGVISPHRDMALISQLMQKVRACALFGKVLVCVDGLVSYIRATKRAFSDSLNNGKRGRPKLVIWKGLCIAQVVKRYAKRCVVAVEHRIIVGTRQRVKTLIKRSQGNGWINTSYIERLNATFRERLCCLVRKGRALVKQTHTLERGMYLLGAIYNFCTYHKSLRLRINGEYYQRTPAMAAGITDHGWTVRSLLEFRVPPPTWLPPKRRGPISKATTLLMKKWCNNVAPI
jgi:transposase-like protein